MLKVLAINGSPRAEGNTAHMLWTVLDICQAAGFETELYQAGGRPVLGCRACGNCRKNPGKCAGNDWINELYPKMLESDAIVLGSPTYFYDLTPEIKCIIDRCGFIATHAGKAFSRKVGAAVTAVRRAGGVRTLDSMQNFFFINDMVVVGSTYVNMSLARDVGDYEKDPEGVGTIKRLGENIVWLLGKLQNND